MAFLDVASSDDHGGPIVAICHQGPGGKQLVAGDTKRRGAWRQWEGDPPPAASSSISPPVVACAGTTTPSGQGQGLQAALCLVFGKLAGQGHLTAITPGRFS